jgi:peptidyl-prolyl cis-trans isomerase C
LQTRVSSSRLRSGLVLAAVSALVAACNQSARKGSPNSEDVLVRVGSEVVLVGDVEAQLARTPPPARARYAMPEERQGFFDKLVQNEILAAEARKLGYDRDPEILMATKKAMVLKLVRERIGEGPKPGEVTGAAMEQYYRQHLSEFQHPEEVHVAEIFVKTKERALEVMREAAKSDLASHKTEGGPIGLEETTFKKLFATYSEAGESKSRDSELVFVVGAKNEYPEALTTAAFAIPRVGDLSPPTETPDGFHILQLRQRVPAVHKTMDEAKVRIMRALSDEGRDRKLEELVREIAKSISVEVFKERFAQVRFETEQAGGQSSPASAAPRDSVAATH